METKTKFKTVDDYLSSLEENQKNILEELRKAIKKAAPEAKELISYNMPAFKFHGILIYYAIYKKHVGLYPASNTFGAFSEELKGYETSKGTIRFPVEKPLPLDLIERIVKFRVDENVEKEKTSKGKK